MNTTSTKLASPIMRCSFPKVKEPDEFGKYSAVGIIHLNEAQAKHFNIPYNGKNVGLDAEDWNNLLAIIARANQVRTEKWANEKDWINVKTPFRKGVQKTEDNPSGYDLTKYPEYAGNLIIQIGSKGRSIPVVDQSGVEIIPEKLKESFYPGCWFMCFIQPYATEGGGVKRVSLGIQGSFRKVKDDTPFISVRNSADEYPEVDLSKYGVDNSASFGGGSANAGI